MTLPGGFELPVALVKRNFVTCKLYDEIINNGCNWVSLSGGGDPLYNYEKNKSWFRRFFRNIPRGVKTELHTSYTNYNGEVYAPYDRVVYHLRNIDDIDYILRENGQTVRVVFVVTEKFTPELIDRIADKVSRNPRIDELSFRQMVDGEYNTKHYCEDYLKNGHKKKWYYIEQNDYNLYYVENKISYKYEDFKEEL